jgi:T4-like virus tail tube protein gp19
MQANFLPELDGKPAGRFFAAKGGELKSARVSEAMGGGHHAPMRHAAPAGYEDLTLICGTGMSRGFYDWLGSSTTGASVRKSGAVVRLDIDGVPTRRVEFTDALVTTLVTPQLDRSSNETAFLTVTISPTRVTYQTTPSRQDLTLYRHEWQKAWNVSSFRLRIDGLETGCARVNQVGSVKLGRALIEDKLDPKSSTKEPGPVKYSDLSVNLPEASADAFYSWAGAVIKGDPRKGSSKSGTLEFFAPASRKAYFGIEFSDLVIASIAKASAARAKSNLPVTVNMAFESAKFHAGASAVL